MTKKVLISLEELEELYSQNIKTASFIFQETISMSKYPMKAWFDAQPPAPQWVSVEDRMRIDIRKKKPPFRTVVIGEWICDDGDIIYVSTSREKIGGKETYCIPLGLCGDNLRLVSWMPIPELPEVE